MTFTVGGFGFAMILGVLSGVLSARLLGPEGRGELAAIQLVPVFLVGIAGLGMPQSIGYYTARKPGDAGKILGTALILSLALAIPVCVIGLAIQFHVMAAFSSQAKLAGAIFVSFVPLALINALPWSSLYGLEMFGAWNLVRMQPQAVYCAILIGATFLGVRAPDRITNLYLLATAIVCVGTTWFLYRKFIGQRLQWDGKTAETIVPYGAISALNMVPNALNQRLDQVLIAAVLNPSQLGYYAVAVSWAGLLNPVMSAIGALILPKLAALPGESGRRTFAAAIRWAALILSVMVAGLLLLTPYVIPTFFGAPFRDAIKPALLLIIAGWFSAINIVMADGFRGCGKPQIPLYAELGGLAITLVGLKILLSRYGIIGAAAVSLISYMASTAVHAGYYLRLYRFNSREWRTEFQEERNRLYCLVSQGVGRIWDFRSVTAVGE